MCVIISWWTYGCVCILANMWRSQLKCVLRKAESAKETDKSINVVHKYLAASKLLVCNFQVKIWVVRVHSKVQSIFMLSLSNEAK